MYKNLNHYRHTVHLYLDAIWQMGKHKNKARTAMYKWLAIQMNLPESETHASKFNRGQCRQAIKILRTKYIQLYGHDLPYRRKEKFEMKIKTTILQEMVAKAIKGASDNKMIPITSLIGIQVTNDTITLMTTDGSNHLRVSQKIETDPMTGPSNFYTIVNADTFAKLVSKTTTEFITLENKENCLEIKANGNYKLEIPINEDGEIIQFPTFILNSETSIELSIEKLKNILTTAKVSIAKTMDIPCLTGYYIADKVVTTDREMMCCINDKIIDKPILVSSEVAELLQLLSGTTVLLKQEDNKLLFETPTITIYGKQLEGLEMYPVKAVEGLTNLTYSACVSVKKQDLLDVLDRMSIFVGDYDKNGIYLSFIEDGLQLRSQKSNATEVIAVDRDANKDFVPFSCLISIEMLKSQIQINSSDLVKLYYGQERSIQIVDGNTTMIICLLSPDE